MSTLSLCLHGATGRRANAYLGVACGWSSASERQSAILAPCLSSQRPHPVLLNRKTSPGKACSVSDAENLRQGNREHQGCSLVACKSV